MHWIVAKILIMFHLLFVTHLSICKQLLMSICGCLGYGKGWGTITQVLQSHCILYAAILYHALAYKMPSISDQTVENCFN